MGEVIRMPSRSAEPWVTKQQLVAHLGVTPRTIERWISLGMPCLKLGGDLRSRVRFRPSEVEDWLRELRAGQ